MVADPAGRLVWTSPALPGATHDLTAARTTGLIDALTAAGVKTFADKGYQGAGGTIITPFKCHRHRPPLSCHQRSVNRAHARIRACGERAVATVKDWNLLTRLRCCPHRATPIVQAAGQGIKGSGYGRIPKATGYEYCPDGEGEVYYSIEGIVQDWANGQPNYGLQIAALSEGGPFTFREYLTSEENYDLGRPPVLFVEYEAPSEPEMIAYSYEGPELTSAPSYEEALEMQIDTRDEEVDPGPVSVEDLRTSSERTNHEAPKTIVDADALPQTDDQPDPGSQRPTVDVVSPELGATDAPANTRVSALFNEPVTGAQVSVRDSIGNSIPGATSSGQNGMVISFTPAQPLVAGATYTAEVGGATDVDGNTMVAPFSWSFTIAITAGCTDPVSEMRRQGLDANVQIRIKLGLAGSPSREMCKAWGPGPISRQDYLYKWQSDPYANFKLWSDVNWDRTPQWQVGTCRISPQLAIIAPYKRLTWDLYRRDESNPPVVRCDEVPYMRQHFGGCIILKPAPRVISYDTTSPAHGEIAKHIQRAFNDPGSTKPSQSGKQVPGNIAARVNSFRHKPLHRISTESAEARQTEDRVGEVCATLPFRPNAQCDEYPYHSSYEGSGRTYRTGQLTNNFSVERVDGPQNGSAGVTLTWFFWRHRVLYDDPFWTVIKTNGVLPEYE